MKTHWILAATAATAALLTACAPGGVRLGAATQEKAAPAADPEYERSRCCELEDPTFHHFKALSPDRVAERFRFRVETEPGILVAGQESRIHLFIEERRATGGDLGTLPERRPNFLVLSDNLEELHHFHPEDLGNWKEAALFEGRFTLSVPFRLGGTHWLIVDFLDKGTIVTQALRLDVQGPAQEPVTWDFARTREGEGLRAGLATAPDTPQAGGLMNAMVTLTTDAGEPVADLERYGDALAHIALVPAGNAAAARHLHGGGQEHSHFRMQKIVPGYRGPKIYFNDTIRVLGRHRALVQFRSGPAVRTVSFDFETGSRPPETP